MPLTPPMTSFVAWILPLIRFYYGALVVRTFEPPPTMSPEDGAFYRRGFPESAIGVAIDVGCYIGSLARLSRIGPVS